MSDETPKASGEAGDATQSRSSAPAFRAESETTRLGDTIALPLAGDLSFEALQERVAEKYGAFGERATSGAAGTTALHEDTDWRSAATIIVCVTIASVALSFLSRPTFYPDGWANTFRLDTAFIVVWGPLLYWGMMRLKLARSVRTYLVLALFIEAFNEAMFVAKGEGGYWDTVMWPASVAFFGTLKEFAGIPGASVPVFFFVTIALLYRAVYGRKSAGYTAPPRFARNALLGFLGVILGLIVLGLLRGGQVEWVFRQTVHMVQLPIVALLFLYALRIPEDLPAVGAAFVVAAAARSVLVAFVYFGICMPQGITTLPGKPEWCTNHSDTVLFVGALVVLIAYSIEQRRRKIVLGSLALGAIIFLGIILNNRRIAFVSLAVAPIAIYFALDASKRKRRITIAIGVLAPLLAGYVLVGSEIASDSPVFKPARSIASILDQKDSSSHSRDIENENLIYTLRESPIFTKGFGHEYEYSPANPPVDLSQDFKNFRLIAHNGVLWLWTVAGPLFFGALWFIFPLAGTLAVRGYRAARLPLERSAALAALGGVVVVIMQIWGDQGINSYLTLVTFGVCFAIAARLSVRQRETEEESLSNS